MRLSRTAAARSVSPKLNSGWRRWALPLCALALAALVRADGTAQTLPFTQAWTNTGLITANDDWSGVPGIIGYRGDGLAGATAVDPQTIVLPGIDGTDLPAGVLDVNANQANPNTFTTGGVAEFAITDPVVALAGSGTARAPFLLIQLITTGQSSIQVAYNLRDIDGSGDNSVQPVALQYRVGNTGNFTNIPAAFVADASTGPTLATLVTPVSVILPAACDNQPLVQLRIITTDAVGSDEWIGIDDISIGPVIVADSAPSVSSTSPADNATGVSVGANLSVTFNEPVNAAAAAFSLSCASSGVHTFVLSGGPTTFSLNPDVDFDQAEVCTVTVDDAQVTDVDVDDPPDNMLADYVFDFTTVDLSSCGTGFTTTYAIQGSGTSSPLETTVVSTEGIVVGDFQGTTGLKGFYIQDPTGDADAATSDGLFVFDGNTPATDVAVGDRVRVTGTVSEAFANTQINPPTSVLVCSTLNSIPTATPVDLPEAVNGDLEQFENMLVVFPETLTVSGNFNLGRFGELWLSSDGRMFQQNSFDRPGSAASIAAEALNLRRYVVLDDGSSVQNPATTPFTDGNNTRRLGDTVTGLEGVLGFDFSEYRVQPTVAPVFVSANARTANPAAVGGNVKVTSFNVLNYFNGNGAGGGFPTSRGADSLVEFNRQRDKIIAAILATGADVLGVIEIENDGNGATSAIQDLVNGLNTATAPGTYAFAEGITPGTDLIKNSIIYKPAAVTPVGAALNDTSAIWTGQARNPLAQLFSLVANGEEFVFIVNHFTSKSCSTNDTGLDADQGDGQGCDNLQRTLQAEALLEFVEERQVTTGETRVLVMGDLNADGEEDPIHQLETDPNDTLNDGTGGLTDLVQQFVPAPDRHAYQFANRSGRLDHALASKELSILVSGATIWNINADEPIVLDYNLENKTPAQQAVNVGTPYRSSDHDPIVVGLNLVTPVAPSVSTPTSTAITSTGATLGGNVTSDGAALITDRGVVYSITTTNADPVIGGTGVTQASTSGTTGVFTVNVTGLSVLTGYSFKAYATNSVGTTYTDVATFTTLPTISIADASVFEGDSGLTPLTFTNMVFTVTLSGPSAQTVTVSATTSNLSAAAGSDYTATGPTVLTFAPTVVSRQFTVPILNDTALESDETFKVTLSAPTNGEILDGQAIGTILNDDGVPPSRVFVSATGSDAADCAIQTTPCRNLAAAVGKVAIDGEVIVLTPGEYDTAPILVGKGVKITSPSGTVAFIRQEITVNAPGGRVALRGLTLKGDSSGAGVTLVAADSLSLEELTFDSWAWGVDISPLTASSVSIVKSSFQANGTGVIASGAAGNRISIIDSRFERNSGGLDVHGGQFIVRDSLFTANGGGIQVQGSGASVDIARSEFWGNGTGIWAGPQGAIRIGRSHVFGNTLGLSNHPSGTFTTFGSNVVRGNGTNTMGTITVVPEQ